MLSLYHAQRGLFGRREDYSPSYREVAEELGSAMLAVYRLGAEEGRIVLRGRRPLIGRWSLMTESVVSRLPFPPRPGRPVPG
jgi:hypothetical protein